MWTFYLVLKSLVMALFFSCWLDDVAKNRKIQVSAEQLEIAPSSLLQKHNRALHYVVYDPISAHFFPCGYVTNLSMGHESKQ